MSLDDERLRDEAGAWFARMRAPDAERSRDEFDRWRLADPAHQAAYDRMVMRWDQTAFLAKQQRQADQRPHWSARLSARAASLALLVAGLGTLAVWHHGQPRGGAALIYANHRTAPETIALQDGSTATLDVGSSLTASFAGDHRDLELVSGRARFAVAHDPNRPFVVHADGGSVTAHGTIFDVTVGPQGMHVVLLRGSVEVRREGVAQVGAMLAPGQEVSLDAAHRLGRPRPVTSAEASWTGDMVSFDATRLADAAATFNRRNPALRIEVGPATADQRITGAFRADDPLGFAQSCAAMFGLEVRRTSAHEIKLEPRQK